MAVRVAISAEKDLPSTGWQCGSYANSQKMPAPLMDGYDLYYRSGVYERRYPAPNPATLQLVLGLLDGDDTRVLDFGCGSGRYAIPLATNRPVRVLAYDPCEEGLRLLRRRAHSTTAEQRIETLTGSLDALPHVWHGKGRSISPSCCSACSAISASAANACATFRPCAGCCARAVASSSACPTPNAASIVSRRPLGAGRACESPAMCSMRGIWEVGRWNCSTTCIGSASWRSNYHEAGYRPISTRSESILPEWLVSRARAAAALDRSLRAVTPTRFAYGFLTVAANGKD